MQAFSIEESHQHAVVVVVVANVSAAATARAAHAQPGEEAVAENAD